MKVGIVSCYYHHNYGSMLQAYATQKIIENMGHNAVTVACRTPITYMTKPKWKYYFEKLLNTDIVKTKLRQIKSKRKLYNYKDVVDGLQRRDRKFDEFCQKRFNLSNMNETRKELTDFTSTCDVVLVGSDMLWHPVNVEHDYYTLSFVEDNIKKISYATSFGTIEIPKRLRQKYIDYLNRFSSISVREKSGIDVCEKLGINKIAKVVLDPTLLFTGEDWCEIQQKDPIISEKYILCYYLGVNPEHRRFAERLKEKTGCKIVALKFLDEFVEEDLNFGDITPYDIGPAELVNLIRNAEFVCTDSFHGTCFSILYHKEFFVMNRFSESNRQSTNTRIDSLLCLLGLENRRINGAVDEIKLHNMIESHVDYYSVDEKLSKERKKSIQYLKDAID